MKVSELDTQTMNRIDLLADRALPMPAIASTLGVPCETVESYLYGEGQGDDSEAGEGELARYDTRS